MKKPPWSKGSIAYVIIVGAALLWILFRPELPLISFSVPISLTPNAEGTITAVEGIEGKKTAVVKLPNGATVRATIPPACVVFPGQVAQLHSWGGSWWGGGYTVLSAKD